MVQMNTFLRQAACNGPRELLVPTHNFAASLHRPRIFLFFLGPQAKHVDQVERTLHGRIQPEVARASEIQKMAQRHIMPALDVLLDPIINAQVVEPVAGLGKVRMGRGKTGLLHLRL